MKLDEALDVLREIANDVCAGLAEKVDREAHWPSEAMGAIQEAGLFGLVVPRSYDGLGLGLTGLTRACEVIAAVCPSTALCYGMHCVGSAVIAAKPSDAQAEKYLRPIVEGRHLTTLALSEPGSGGHFYYPQAGLEKVPDGYRVNGTKSFVTNGGQADSYVISVAGTQDGLAPGNFSCLLLPASTEGLRWGGPWTGMGMRGNSSRTLFIEGAELPAEALLGAEGEQIWYVFNVIAPFFLCAMSGVYLGIATAAIEKAVGHVSGRRYAHTGAGPSESQVVQWRLGSSWATVERTRRLIYGAAAAGDEGRDDAIPMILSSKAEVADAAVSVVNDAMTLMGGIAYAKESDMERLMRDVRAAHVMAPTTDLLRTWTGRWLLGIPLLSD